MKRLALSLAACLCALGALPGPAGAFGLHGFEVRFLGEHGEELAHPQAGSHPFAMETFFEVDYQENAEGKPEVDGDIKDLLLTQIEGFAGSTTAVPRCSNLDFATIVSNFPSCPEETVVGALAAFVNNPHEALPAAVYNLTPPPGVPARLGFEINKVPVTIDVGLKPSPDYNIVADLANNPQPLTVFGAATQLWGQPADPAHDFARGPCLGTASPPSVTEGILEGRLNLIEGGPECHSEEPPEAPPFLTMPRSCEGPLFTAFEADSWWAPGAFVTGSAPSPAMGGCEQLEFNPRISSKATADSAAAGTGLDFGLSFKDPVDGSGEGLIEAGRLAQSDLKRIEVTLPRGMSADPSLAEGLGVCTPADLGRESIAAEAGEGCPDSSKIGTVAVDTPLVNEQITGNVYIAQPDDPASTAHGAENPFDTLIAFYIVLKNKDLGVLVKVPAKVEPDPATGQLTTVVEDAPQVPFSDFHFHFREGLRAPLITPPGCGTHTTVARLTPWARPNETIVKEASFQITRGPEGGPCPSGPAPFGPGFEAGSLSAQAGAHSPFYMRLTRKDGEQDMTRLSSVLPPGVVGRIAGVARCPEAAISLAGSKSGLAEREHPSCPEASEIGRTVAGAGVGSALTYVPGSLYLAGPYNGDPLSVVSVTPALAGPFDAGTVVVRFALTLNPISAEVEVDGSASDPIPHILRGIPLNVRDLRVYADRPEFTLNPTSCAPESARATLWGGGTALAPAPDSPVALSTPYHAVNCAKLAFKPRLALRLRGGTRRGAFPALHAVYVPRSGEANLSRLALAFPRSEFVEQGHFRTICTRVQFAAGPGHGARCPKGSVYGHVKAFTPLLDEPLQGPVYLRSSDHNLPDAVFALHGPPSAEVDLEVAVRIDSVKGRLRATVQNVPDAPVTRTVVDMQGGQKGLFVNSRNLCFKPGANRARANLLAQNGRRDQLRPLLRARGCHKRRAHKRHQRHARPQSSGR